VSAANVEPLLALPPAGACICTRVDVSISKLVVDGRTYKPVRNGLITLSANGVFGPGDPAPTPPDPLGATAGGSTYPGPRTETIDDNTGADPGKGAAVLVGDDADDAVVARGGTGGGDRAAIPGPSAADTAAVNTGMTAGASLPLVLAK
jgi:hypothetical protein